VVLQQMSLTLSHGVERRGHFMWGCEDPLPLVEKLFSGGDIKVAKVAWRVPSCRAFVASQVVLFKET
jgi:hypothetical protein